jgi:hypothetical protein
MYYSRAFLIFSTLVIPLIINTVSSSKTILGRSSLLYPSKIFITENSFRNLFLFKCKFGLFFYIN